MEAMAETLEERRAEALVELEDALEEIESGEGLSTFVEGHGIQSRVFRFEWREPALQISYELPTGRVLSGEDAEKDDSRPNEDEIAPSDCADGVRENNVCGGGSHIA